MLKLSKGVVLNTLNGNYYTNAVVLSVDDNIVSVLSDYGNILKFDKKEIELFYSIDDHYKEFISLGMNLPTVEERIEEQIEKLSKVLNTLKI